MSVKNLEMRDLGSGAPEIPGQRPSGRRSRTQRGGHDAGGGDGAARPEAQDTWSHQDPEEAGRTLLRGLWRERRPARTPTADFWPPREQFLLCEVTVCGHLSQGPGDTQTLQLLLLSTPQRSLSPPRREACGSREKAWDEEPRASLPALESRDPNPQTRPPPPSPWGGPANCGAIPVAFPHSSGVPSKYPSLEGGRGPLSRPGASPRALSGGAESTGGPSPKQSSRPSGSHAPHPSPYEMGGGGRRHGALSQALSAPLCTPIPVSQDG